MNLRRTNPPPVPVLDDEAYRRAQRLAQYSYSAPRRVVQFLKGLLAPVPYGVLGLDCSYWQPALSFETAHLMGVLWAYIRALYGLTPDLKFPVHYANAKPVMARTAYMYYLDALDPKAQAQELFETCQANGDLGDFSVIFDLEGINNLTLTASKVKTCLEELTKLFGKKPLIYSGFYIIRDLLKGDKSFLVFYSLLIAGYPFGFQWFDDLPLKVLSYPPMIPEPFKMWTTDEDEPLEGRVVGWQFTSSAPGALYGASSTFLDLDICSPAFLKQVLNKVPPPVTPPPDPIGDEPLMQFIAKTTVNIRPAPTTAAKDIGNVPMSALVTALGMKLYPGGSFWVKFEPLPAWLTEPAAEYWACLEINAGSILMDYHAAVPAPPPPPPVPTLKAQANGNAPLHYWKDKNGAGFPLMVKPDNPPKFTDGQEVIVSPTPVDADGSTDYYLVYNGHLATFPTYTPPAGWTGWFASEQDLIFA